MERRAITIQGVVQGVGFRPFVYRLAHRYRLAGYVRNELGSVLIEAEGEPASLDRFQEDLARKPPPLAQVVSLHWKSQPTRGEASFRIVASGADGQSPVFLSPDVATCDECLTELCDPDDRHFGYPFLNCTNCGPRLTIITGAPYDRSRTTMAPFAMCEPCRAEYEDPGNRRFHAQPTACPTCGPSLRLLDALGNQVPTDEPLNQFASAILQGKVGALKGLGGYHFICDARDREAVARLRRRKHREEKPFAVMVADVEAAARLGVVGKAERDLLISPRAPIVLLRKRTELPICREVAPGNPWLGVMLPYSPLHHLLMQAVGEIPLVMTSGNQTDEPIAYREDAISRLAGIADLFLTHDRAIHLRCDDSVTRVVDGEEQPIRRSRGDAPSPIPLPFDCPRPILAVGGQLKATFALGRGRQAFLSHHLGDLDRFEAYRAFEQDVRHYEDLFAIRPTLIAHDLHPDYASSRYARQRSRREGIELLNIQHHHAHLASCMAENDLREPVIGVTFDGTGFGTDGAIWGGEFLVGDYQQFQRKAHFRYVGIPGGDRAIREPWRMALSHLWDANLDFSLETVYRLHTDAAVIVRMLERQFQTPLTSSVGRLFDAVAALAGIRDRVQYEGQAAVELEWLATTSQASGAYPFELVSSVEGERMETPLVIDTRPLIREVARDARRGVAPGTIARRFQTTLVDLTAEVCRRIRQAGGPEAVVLSGGVFLNALLSTETSARLRNEGFRVYRHRLVPPNDGGLSLGQLAIAAACAGN